MCVSYEEAGAGTPVLLVHGLLSAPTLWNGVAGPLAERFRVIRCDLRRAAGKSRTDGLLDLMDRLGLPCVHLVGHGSGCATVAAVAARAPERIRAIAVVDPVVPRAEATSAVQEAWHLENLLQWLTVAYGSTVRAPQHVAAIQAIVAQQTHAHLGERPPGLFPPGATAWGEAPGTGSITCPVLALTGEHNPAECQAMVGRLFGAMPGLVWRQVPGAGRHSPREAPDGTARLLLAFLTANG